MKWFKFLLWLIVIALLATLVYQNLEYFNSATVLNLDLKVQENWQWQIPEFQTGYYMLICFAAGLLLTGFKALGIKLGLKKEIKTQSEEIDRLKDQINELKTELEFFKHDPYIKKALTADALETSSAPKEENESKTDPDHEQVQAAEPAEDKKETE